MKVILLQDIPKVGRKYDVKTVADGYAGNFLIPRGLAEIATAVAVKRLEGEKARFETDKKIKEKLLAKNLESLDKVIVGIKAGANEQGHLFAGIHGKEIAEALAAETRLQIPTEAISLEKPIKKVGEFVIPIAIGNKKTSFKLVVSAS